MCNKNKIFTWYMRTYTTYGNTIRPERGTGPHADSTWAQINNDFHMLQTKKKKNKMYIFTTRAIRYYSGWNTSSVPLVSLEKGLLVYTPYVIAVVPTVLHNLYNFLSKKKKMDTVQLTHTCNEENIFVCNILKPDLFDVGVRYKCYSM